jgi:hypothetical protein
MPYWLFIVIGVSLLGGLLVSIHEKRNWNYMFMSILFFFGLIVILSVPAMTLTADSPHYAQKYEENTTIYSLRTIDSISGSFVLGTGSVGSDTYYAYYTQASDGAYSINKLEADQVKIYMDRDSGGVLTKVWGKIDDENLAKHWGWSETIFSHYEFHLPYGSLVQEYSAR